LNKKNGYTSTGAPMNALVLIDPEIEASGTLADRLQMQGYAVSIFTDPAEGARVALGDPPCAVIADLWMPGISGVQLCRLLKAEPATESVPVILRGPESPRNRFWSERAGASDYVVKGRMGDLVRALGKAIQNRVDTGDFFTTYAELDIRDRITAHLDAALFESVLAAEVRALGTCGAFDQLFDLFSQFVSRVATYRWLAVATHQPRRLGLHCNPRSRDSAEREARAALAFEGESLVLVVEDEDACEGAEYRAPLLRPIELGGIPIGHLALSLPEAAKREDENLVTIVARELGGPLRMATLMEESQRLATIDALTGLMNRRALVSALDVELERCRRYGHPLSLVLFDVDHFKMINDRRGHGAGDAVLSALGRLLQSEVRKTDLAGRWGGEEFVIALTSSELEGARCFGERLRTAIENLRIEYEGGAAVSVTASLGIAAHQPGDSLDALVDRADRAMYLAKSGGRNRVVVATDSGSIELPTPSDPDPSTRAA